ncbi:MAG: pyruvate-ferredoxin/flavodoxin oxidoreductase [Verrucomicrobiales bacterium]|jgi:pyruvate-ferredoxin/flavodoxin oxidoreductase
MQGNTFLGAFFKVSTFLDEYELTSERLLELVEHQYNKKFGRFGDAVVDSNMTVFKGGFERVTEIKYGESDDKDRSSINGVENFLDFLMPSGV